MSQWLKFPESWLLPELTAHLGFLLAIVFVAHLLRQPRSPSSTIAWLLLIVFLPYLGVPLYLMFGGRKINRMARRKAEVYDRARGHVQHRSHRNAEGILRSYGVPPGSGENSVELLTRSEEAFRIVCQLIREATSTIHITTYILGKGEVGEQIVALLVEKARSGVQVRLLLDDVGSWRIGRSYITPLINANAKVAYFMPMLHLPFRGRANLRNHRKILVVDHKTALTGGMNLAWPYLSTTADPKAWKDLSALVKGPAVHDLEALFFSDWAFATGENLTSQPRGAAPVKVEHPPESKVPPAGDSYVQVVASGPDVPDDPLYETLVSQIFDANERIWIITPYFVPDEMLARALKLAARRGVDVRLIIPEHSNHMTTDLARVSYLRELDEAGAQVLLYHPVMIHAKVVIFDDRLAVIGSANMDNRSLFLNYEVALFLYSRREIDELAGWARGLQNYCRPNAIQGGWFRELLENVVRLFSPLL